MSKKTFLFLDFDGVICDSVGETFASSWIAYHELKGRLPDSIRLRDKELFYAIRPYIRDAEDYLILHHCVEHGIEVADQEQFDSVAASLGPGVLDEYHQAFFRARRKIIDDDSETWLRLNPLYPFMEPLIDGFGKCDAVHILSSKRKAAISLILDHIGVEWNGERIHYAPGKEKIPYLRRFLDDLGPAAHEAHAGPDGWVRAYFIEDQIDNVQHNGDERIKPYLAGWGYLREEWRHQDRVPLLDADSFIRLAESVCAARGAAEEAAARGVSLDKKRA
jgi:hypothetical protein